MVVWNIFYVHPYLGKISNLTNIFQLGWNHQPANNVKVYRIPDVICFLISHTWSWYWCTSSPFQSQNVSKIWGSCSPCFCWGIILIYFFRSPMYRESILEFIGIGYVERAIALVDLVVTASILKVMLMLLLVLTTGLLNHSDDTQWPFWTQDVHWVR